MKKVARVNEIKLIIGSVIIGLLCVTCTSKVSGNDNTDKHKAPPLASQVLNYTENPIDISNPDRGPYRGRWQSLDTPFGITPEVDHRVPVDANSVLYHGRQMPPVEGDDIEETQFYNRVNQKAKP